MNKLEFSEKQLEFFNNRSHRWNIKCGATRSGKTYMDYYLIPMRIRECAGKNGIVLLLGNTKGTLQKNIIDPLREIWGDTLVSDIRSDNTASLFGEKCYCLGADKVSQVNRIRGCSVKYCYGDEVVTWHKDVFTMLKSRLDKPYSRFDGTCNPEGRLHWFKAFLDECEKKGIDLYVQNYCIDDNPYLNAGFVENLKKEYSGTVYYDRYILGKWTSAEGVIYRSFADDPEKFVIDEIHPEQYVYAQIGVDFGGGTSAHAFNCTAFERKFTGFATIADYRRKDAATPAQLYEDFFVFLEVCRKRLHGVPLVDVYCDSAEQTLIGGLRAEAARRRAGVEIHNAYKKPINDRIRFYTIMQGAGRYHIYKECGATIEAFRTAVWKDNETTDVRLDDGSTNIDNLDAQEYSTESVMKEFLARN
jgi:PBSX family phage terminase large subunit